MTINCQDRRHFQLSAHILLLHVHICLIGKYAFLWVSFPPRPETVSSKHGYLQYLRHCGSFCQGLRKSGTPLSEHIQSTAETKRQNCASVGCLCSCVHASTNHNHGYLIQYYLHFSICSTNHRDTLSNITYTSLFGSCTETPDAGADACILVVSTVDLSHHPPRSSTWSASAKLAVIFLSSPLLQSLSCAPISVFSV